MPDVLSIGLGGGSLLRFPAAPASAGTAEPGPAGCRVGPDSVGAALEQQALCFGGPTATASDAAVLLGHMQLGSRPAAEAGLSGEQAQAAWAEMQRMLEAALDRAKTEAGGWQLPRLGRGAGVAAAVAVVCLPQHITWLHAGAGRNARMHASWRWLSPSYEMYGTRWLSPSYESLACAGSAPLTIPSSTAGSR